MPWELQAELVSLGETRQTEQLIALRRWATRGHERLVREIADGTRSSFEKDERRVLSCDGKLVDRGGKIKRADPHTLYVVLTDRRLLLFLLRNKGFTWGLAKPPNLIVASARENARAAFDRERSELRMYFGDGITIGPEFTMRTTSSSTSGYAAKIAAAVSPLEPSEPSD